MLPLLAILAHWPQKAGQGNLLPIPTHHFRENQTTIGHVAKFRHLFEQTPFIRSLGFGEINGHKEVLVYYKWT